MNNRIESLATQILRNVGGAIDKVAVSFLQRMLSSRAVSDVRDFDIELTPSMILVYDSLLACADAYGTQFVLDAQGQMYYSPHGGFAKRAWDEAEEDYSELRTFMLERLGEAGISVEQYLNYEQDTGLGVSKPVVSSRVRGPGQRPTGAEKLGLVVGDRVRHAKWAGGTVSGLSGEGDKSEITIDFDDPLVGTKRLLLAWSPVIRVEPDGGNP